MKQEFESKAAFVRLGKRCPGVFYEPAGREAEKLTTVLVMHSDEDYLSCPTGPELARRGFRVLCANVPGKEGMFFSQIEKMHAVKAAVEYLRGLSRVGSIVLMGHSGGATLMTAYQAVAENGCGVFQGAERIYPYGKWYNQHPKELPAGRGNLRYKLWNPVDHWDHRFVNGRDDADGVWSVETLDIGESGDPSCGIPAISHNIDLLEYGLSPEKKAELEAAGCRVEGCWEEFPNTPGHHLVLRFSRPCPLGGRENIQCEWMGYWAKDGRILRDPDTPVDEAYLKNVLTHNTIERAHLAQVLPDLYAEFHDMPVGD